MEFVVSACSDVGITKKTNQDSLSVKKLRTKLGSMTFAILCDGMGGLSSGEVASASVIYAFNKWLIDELPTLCENGRLEDVIIRQQWSEIISIENEKLKQYGMSQGINLGTTAVVMLLTQTRYYILNVGDSRAYEIQSHVRQITKDQTLVAREVEEGRLTPEQAAVDKRKNILLQCVGASDNVFPEMFYGNVKKDAVYMLCSDGFRHEISSDEIYEKLNPYNLNGNVDMDNKCKQLIELNKQRRERDNISVALIRTY